MSRFYASIHGNRGEATRCGHDSITGHIRGWNVGVRVDGHGDGDTDADTFYVYATGGSGYAHGDRLLGSVTLVDGAPTFVPATAA